MRPMNSADVVEVHRVIRAAERADGIPIVTPIEEIEEWLTAEDGDPALDIRIVETEFDGGHDGQHVAERGGERPVVGVAWVHKAEASATLSRSFVFGAVHPDHRRQGIGTALLTWGIARCRELLALDPPKTDKVIRLEYYDFQSDAIALGKRFGFTAARFEKNLIRPLTDLPTLETPDGIRIEVWDPARSEELRLVRNAAFQDHWGSTPVSAAAWRDNEHGHGARPDLSFMALDQAGRIVASTRAEHYPDDESVTGRREGLLDQIATLRECRGRGIASALIIASLHRFAEEGFTHAALTVDSQNPTGAFRLYANLGFVEAYSATSYVLMA